MEKKEMSRFYRISSAGRGFGDYSMTLEIHRWRTPTGKRDDYTTRCIIVYWCEFVRELYFFSNFFFSFSFSVRRRFINHFCPRNQLYPCQTFGPTFPWSPGAWHRPHAHPHEESMAAAGHQHLFLSRTHVSFGDVFFFPNFYGHRPRFREQNRNTRVTFSLDPIFHRRNA